MKLKDVTPKKFACLAGGCPAIFETDRGTCLIIGTKVESAESLLAGRIGLNETVIEVPVEIIRLVKQRESIIQFRKN
jgi:hypothetical protein